AINYKLRDWVFSRQRYWGEPIPIVHCPNCGPVPVPEEDLPLELPDIDKYEPTGTAQSPLAEVDEWANTTCPKCGEKSKRETNTMPQWAGSCWYYLRYLSPKNNENLVDPKKEKEWMPVDLYVGGAEHAVLHLLYARFWHKFLYDIGVVSTKEPFKKLKNQGLILAESGKKMSKSKGNVVNPNDIVDKYGADVLRLYEMFMGPFEEEVVWNDENILGARRFLEKVMNQLEKVEKGTENKKLEELTHRTIKKVTSDVETFKFNTAISSMMILAKEMEKEKEIPQDYFEKLILMLSPFAPHFCEEIWERIGHKKSIQLSSWPTYNKKIAKKDTVEIIVQVNGKLRDKFKVEAGAKENEIKKIAQNREKVKKWLKGKKIKKIIFVKDKLINFVIN
ncbi:MAG: class I tRNA ligase family protein, partial [Minisyncoccales bacterium]